MMGDIVDEKGLDVRKANRKLLVGLIVFSLALTALVIIWMHRRSERLYNEGLKKSPEVSMLDSRPFSC